VTPEAFRMQLQKAFTLPGRAPPICVPFDTPATPNELMQPFTTFWAVTAFTQGTAAAEAAMGPGGTPAAFLAGNFLAGFFLDAAFVDIGGAFFFAIV